MGSVRIGVDIGGTFTNAVLENKLLRTALITSGGFKDVLEIGRHFRPDMYDLQQGRAVPLIPRDRRYGLKRRTAADGEVQHKTLVT